MFKKIQSTQYPPQTRPLMLYDGKCGFCKYWIIKWKKISGLEVEYLPYQEAAQEFPDIPEFHFKEAVRFIAMDGKVYNGPDAAYITYYNRGKLRFLHLWYENKAWFRKLSDFAYQKIADNRYAMSKVSIWLFGKNPANPKPYWKIYLLILVITVIASINLILW